MSNDEQQCNIIIQKGLDKPAHAFYSAPEDVWPEDLL